MNRRGAPTSPAPTEGTDHDVHETDRSSCWAAVSDSTVSFFIAEQLITGALNRPDYLIGSSEYANALTTAAFLAFVDGSAVVGIAVSMFLLLKRHSEPLVLGYVGLRCVGLGNSR